MEEEVLGYMEVTEEALTADGVIYQHLDVEDYMDVGVAVVESVESTEQNGSEEGVVVEPTEVKDVGEEMEISEEHEKEIVMHELEMMGGSS